MRRRDFLALGMGVAASLAGCAASATPPRGLGRLTVAAAGERWNRIAQAYGRVLSGHGYDVSTTATRAPGAQLTVTGLPALAADELNGVSILKSAVPLARLAGQPVAVVVPANSRFADFDAFAAHLRGDPAGVYLAGGPEGETAQLLFGLIAQGVGADTRLVDYAGYAGRTEVVAALLGGHAAVAAGTLDVWRDWIDARRVRVLAVSTDERVAEVDAPTLKECGVRLAFAEWCGVFCPATLTGSSREAALRACDEAAHSDDWLTACQGGGWTPMPLSGDDFTQWVTTELARTRKVLRDLGLLDTRDTTYRG